MAGALSLLLAILFFVFVIPVQAQQAQEYVGRFDAFTGFSYMASPSANLYQRGFNGEFGVNVTRWLALGADFSILTGNTSILPQYLTPALQQELGLEIASLGGLPPGYSLYVPYSGKTWTFAAGPQVNFRQMKYVTLFVRPDLGAIHETATLKPIDPIQTIVVQALAPSSQKLDTVVFYGVGGGFDVNASKHVALKVTVDYVHCFLFENLLKDSRNTVRMSIGPTFRFGGNVK
jgi:hypothetical protein